MDTPKCDTGKLGRPPRHEIDSIHAKNWYYDVSCLSGMISGYELEKRFSPWNLGDGETYKKRPCKFDKYRRGEHLPSRDLIKQVGKTFPHTEKRFDHCFWKIAKYPQADLTELYGLVNLLRPNIRNLILLPKSEANSPIVRCRTGTSKIFEELRKEGDLDALSACLALIHENNILGSIQDTELYTRYVFHIFVRSFSRLPYEAVSFEFCEYLFKHFLNNGNRKKNVERSRCTHS